ncbi:MAG: phosphatase PAP2 family protein [Sporichthyaceae bacterium]
MVDTAHRALSVPRARAGIRWSAFSRELIAMGLLFLIYKFGRSIHSVDVSVAYENARTVWDFERWVNMPNELSAQNAILAGEHLTKFANVYYVWMHWPATVAFLLWMYFRRPMLYPPVRRAIIGMTFIALILHLVYPLAPPRMLSDLGFVDTGALYGPSMYGPPAEGSVINQYAAMPSLHVGWAMLVAAGLIAALNSRWRWLWLLHPTLTAVAVVVTANHYWLDGIAACVLLAAVTFAFSRLSLPRWARLPWSTALARRWRGMLPSR